MRHLISALCGWGDRLWWGNSARMDPQAHHHVQESLAFSEGAQLNPHRPLTNVKVAALLAGGGILLVGIVGAGVFAASGRLTPMAVGSPSPTATPARGNTQALCDQFVSHMAQDLGKNAADVKAAVAKAVGQTIDDQVAAGKLTRTQADSLKKQLANRSLCSGSLFGSEALKNGGTGTHESDDTTGTRETDDSTPPSGAHPAESDD